MLHKCLTKNKLYNVTLILYPVIADSWSRMKQHAQKCYLDLSRLSVLNSYGSLHVPINTPPPFVTM